MKISVIIPTYNRAALLVYTLNSVLAQIRLPDEIIVVDDGSTDNTRDLVLSYGSRVIYHYQRQAGGCPAATRNTGQGLATGDALLFLDSDDLLLPDALASLEAALGGVPKAAVAYCRSQTIDEHNRLTDPLPQIEDYQGNVWSPLVERNFIRSPGAALIRHSCLDVVGMWDIAPRLRASEDWDMWLRLAEASPFVRVETPLFQYRIHGGGLSANELVMYSRALVLLEKHGKRHRGDPTRLRCLTDAYVFYYSATWHRWLTAAKADWRCHNYRAALTKGAYLLRLDACFPRLFRPYALDRRPREQRVLYIARQLTRKVWIPALFRWMPRGLRLRVRQVLCRHK